GFRLLGGEGGIRTRDTLLEYTHFPGALLQPLGHLSIFNGQLVCCSVLGCKGRYFLWVFQSVISILGVRNGSIIRNNTTAMDLSFILNHLGEEREDYLNAVAPPVMQTSNFAFRTVDEMRRGLREEFSYPAYTRGVNPTVEMLREKMAALEGAEDALVFASGSGAIASAVMSNVNQGDHIVSVRNPYSWTNTLFTKLLPGFGVEASFVDGNDSENFERAIRPDTRILYLESPNSFTFELQDLRAVSAIAKKHGILTMIDNSYSSPLYQQPLKLGIDLSIHSATKYI